MSGAPVADADLVSGTQSPAAQLVRRVGEALAKAGAVVKGVEPLGGGACQDHFRVDATIDGEARRFVLRSDAPGALPGSLRRDVEYGVIEAARAASVPTPAVRWLSQGLVRDGAHAYFMDWANGEAIGARVTRDPALEGARAKLPGQLADALAAIHRVTPAGGTLGLDRAPSALAADGDAAKAAVHALAVTLDGLPEPRPAMELALAWLVEHAPPKGEVVLAHGDFRTGNFLVSPAGLEAVLDWEFSHWSSPFEDVGWLCVRDWRFGKLDKPAGGVASRATFYDAYARASGRTVDRAEVHWWEVLGNVKWAAGAVCQGVRYVNGEHDIELVAIARRAAEMEWEALRLIEKGPV